MFARFLGHNADRQTVDSGTLSRLAPYRGLPQASLASLLPQVEHLELAPGLIDQPAAADCLYFLHSGALQIQTRTGFVVTLQADSAAARYPLPGTEAVASLFVPDQAALLSAPRPPSPEERPTAPHRPPALTPDETAALSGLQDYFRGRHRELPSLPDLAWKIGRAIGDPDNTDHDIAKLIQLDPPLTARLISIVNSAAFGTAKKTKTIQHAVTRLGRVRMRNLVYSCLLKGSFKIKSAALKRRMEAIWQHSAEVAALSFVLGRLTPGIDAEQAMLGGLVHDIGSVAVIGGLTHYPVLTERPEVLDHTLASQRTELGLLTLQHWGLHEQFADVVLDADNWFRIGSAIAENPDVVIIARLHASIGSPQRSELPQIDQVPAFEKLAHGELTPQRSLAVLDEAESEVREVRALLSDL